jgi:hypothetical protein
MSRYHGAVTAVLPTDLSFLDERERALVTETIRFVGDDEYAEILIGNLQRLGKAAELIRTSPSILRSLQMRPKLSFTTETLIDALCRVPDWDLDLNIPTKAVFGQAYLIAKINFFKAIGYALDALQGPERLKDDVERELGQSIYSKLAEELFITIITDPNAPRAVKIGAAKPLFQVWEDRLLTEIDDFAPVLESIWKARNEVRPVLGTMRGTQEFFRLVQAACDERFVDYFAAGDVPEEQRQAFEEFLFGISHEEITKLREHLEAANDGCVSIDDARALLGRSGSSWAPSSGPQALYTSYKRRRVKAHYRALTGAPGPKKTAEEYVMIAFLQRDMAP